MEYYAPSPTRMFSTTYAFVDTSIVDSRKKVDESTRSVAGTPGGCSNTPSGVSAASPSGQAFIVR
ncbi:protein of unknown function [Pseudodesulfovibrio profundus]|uniref:Uncharacterized protein n=1 Tax=Pseudodesulfovibrio profundus TaxID=57320 RepID=A0A2C8FD48_9BACT|nr:protein of unknown function [Pseudodesulfovibrio profundus]